MGPETSNARFPSQVSKETEPGSWVLPSTPLGSVPQIRSFLWGMERLLFCCLLVFSGSSNLHNEFIYKPPCTLDIMSGILSIYHRPVVWSNPLGWDCWEGGNKTLRRWHLEGSPSWSLLFSLASWSQSKCFYYTTGSWCDMSHYRPKAKGHKQEPSKPMGLER